MVETDIIPVPCNAMEFDVVAVGAGPPKTIRQKKLANERGHAISIVILRCREYRRALVRP